VEFSSQGAEMVKEAVDDLARKHGPPAMFVIDTLARAFPADSDENSSKDMTAFINTVDQLRDRYKCVAVIVHHSGHSNVNRSRGSSVLKAALDWEFQTKKINNNKGKGKLEATKMKESDLPEALTFEIMSIDESAVIIFGGVALDNKFKLNKSEKFALTVLESTFSRIGRQFASVEEWREDFYKLDTAEKQDTKRQNFDRARNALVDKGILLFDGKNYSFARQPGQVETKD